MTGRPAGGSVLVWLVAATALCYGIGYPLALIGHSVAGWVLVFLGGPCLIGLGVVAIRRVHRSSQRPAAAEPGDARPRG